MDYVQGVELEYFRVRISLVLGLTPERHSIPVRTGSEECKTGAFLFYFLGLSFSFSAMSL